MVSGLEFQDLTGLDCYYANPVCLWPDTRLGQFSSEPDVTLLTTVRQPVILDVTVVGEFQSREGRYCHLGGRDSQLVVFAIESAKQVRLDSDVLR